MSYGFFEARLDHKSYHIDLKMLPIRPPAELRLCYHAYPAERTPEMEFNRLGLLGKIQSYEVSSEMPLAIAVEFALHQARMQGTSETVFFKW